MYCRFFKKKSCSWHWVLHDDAQRPYTKIGGDPNAKGGPGKWETIIIMRPMLRVSPDIEWSWPGAYRVGFRSWDGLIKVCTIVVPGMKDPTIISATDIALTVGKEDVEFFAETFSDNEFSTGYPLRLQIIKRTTRTALPHQVYRNVLLI